MPKETPEQKAIRIEKWKNNMQAAKLAKKQQKQGDVVIDSGQDVIVDEMPNMSAIGISRNKLGDSSITREPNNQHIMSQTAVLEHEDNKVVAPAINEIRGKIAIKPYISGEENMGLEKYEGEVLFPGIYQIDRIGCIDNNGYKTYFTGLNENAPEVQTLPEKEKIARITTIRTVVAYLENTISSNFKVKAKTCMKNYGTDDDKFWENVTTFNSSGPDKFDQKGNRIPTYWDGVDVQLDNDGIELDKSNPHDLVKYYAILASGLSMIAPSLKTAMDSLGAYKFYLDQPEETADIKTEQKILRNQAGSALESMRINDETRLFLMSKVLAVRGSSNYRRGGPNYTPVKQMYQDQNEYIDGKKGDNATIAVQKFLEYYEMPIDILTRRAVIKDATELHLIELKGDGRLWFKNDALGKTIEDMVEMLNNPLHEGTWKDLRNKVEAEWAN